MWSSIEGRNLPWKLKRLVPSYIKFSINPLSSCWTNWLENYLIKNVAALRNCQCNVCLRKIKTLCHHALFEFLSGWIGSSGAHKRTLLVAGKEEPARRQQLIIISTFLQFYNQQEEDLNQKSPRVIDRFVFRNLTVDNVGQTANNKNTGSMIFPLFLLTSKTDKQLGDDTF